MVMFTYRNDALLKAAFLAELRAHEEADQIVQGVYARRGEADEFRGCAIGCALHSLNRLQHRADEFAETDRHDRYEAELGLPIWLAYMEDRLFEQLPIEHARTWPRRFAEAIPIGAVVTDRVLAQVLRWTLAAERFGIRHAARDAEVVGIVDRMAALFDREIAGASPSEAEWNEAARDARAAWTARAAWDAWAAWDARAAWAAWDAWAARAAWAARDAEILDAFYPALSEYLLSLLRELPVDGRRAE